MKNGNGCTRILTALFAVALLAALLWIVASGGAILPTVLLLALLMFLVKRVSLPLFPLLLFALAFGVRLFFVLKVHTPIMSDFDLIYTASQQFAAGDFSFQYTDYFQLWAYQSGQVIYQGTLLKLWNDPVVIRLASCLFSAGTTVLIYLTAKEFWSEKAAQVVSIFEVFFLFHASHVTLLTNSIPSAFFLYLGLYLLLARALSRWHPVLKYALAGLSVAVGGFLRPDAVVVLVAVFAYLIFGLVHTFSGANLLRFGQRFLAFFLTYVLLTAAASQCVMLSGVNANGMQNGDAMWKFVLGTNTETGGRYSQADWDRTAALEAQGLSHSEAQMQVIAEHLSVPPQNILQLLHEKTRAFWSESPLPWSFEHMQNPALAATLDDWNAAFTSCALALALVGCAVLLLGKNPLRLKALLLPFVVFATFCVYLLIEVQPRYAYFVWFAVFMLAAGGVDFVMKRLK